MWFFPHEASAEPVLKIIAAKIEPIKHVIFVIVELITAENLPIMPTNKLELTLTLIFFDYKFDGLKSLSAMFPNYIS